MDLVSKDKEKGADNMSYIDWEYYSSLFAEVPEDEFEKLNKRAEMQIDVCTHNRVHDFMEGYNADAATSFQKTVYSAIQITVCELINKMQVQDSSGQGNGLAAVSNDGYSESYKITTESEKKAEIHAVIRMGLSGTGMVGAL